ncbi:MAG TPA: L,D-transpeptidase [Coriobacteriia bacterium]
MHGGRCYGRRIPVYASGRPAGGCKPRNLPERRSGTGTRALYLDAPGIRIHGIPPSEDWSIGSPASHGCMRMHRRDAEDL